MTSKGNQIRDVLGADVIYGYKFLKITMASTIRKIIEKYQMTGAKTVDVSCVARQPNNPDLAKPAGNFPVRECVGSLLHVANMAR